MLNIHKYPRTQHIEGSRLQPGDQDLEAIPFEQLAGRHLVVEEKMDGANCGMSFSPNGDLLLQSRGHFLTGGPREKHFTLFKQWAHTHAASLHGRLGSRYVLYGEWLYAKHTIFYDALPHYLMEFDVLDTETSEFLSTPRRSELLQELPVVPVRVLREGRFGNLKDLIRLLGPSAFTTPDHLLPLRVKCDEQGLDPERILRETDPSTDMEGLYVKVEEGGIVTGRYKYIRPSFLTAVVAAEGHWLNRPIIPNLLREGVDLFDVGQAGEHDA